MTKLRTILPCFSCALLLGGCAGDGANPDHKVVPLDQVMVEAGAAVKAGQADQALALLKGATAAFPADKTPWLQMAQIKFNQGNYAEAIGNALEALQRDPKDKAANGLVTISGLRLAARALDELNQQNNLGGALRVEAQELAKRMQPLLADAAPAGPARPQGKHKPGAAGGAGPHGPGRAISGSSSGPFESVNNIPARPSR